MSFHYASDDGISVDFNSLLLIVVRSMARFQPLVQSSRSGAQCENRVGFRCPAESDFVACDLYRLSGNLTFRPMIKALSTRSANVDGGFWVGYFA
jgi:hypothetical protein